MREVKTLTCKSGRQLTAQVFDKREALPQVPGIYVISRFDGNFYILFVEQSEDIRRSVDNHNYQDRFVAYAYTHVLTIAVPRDDERNFFVQELIENYNPPINDQYIH